MQWKLESFYSLKQWKSDFAKLEWLWTLSDDSEARRLSGKLWAYAHARAVMDLRDSEWAGLRESVEKLEEKFNDDDPSGDEVGSTEDLRSKIFSDFLSTFKDKSWFQTVTSVDPLLRFSGYQVAQRFFKPHLEKLHQALSERLLNSRDFNADDTFKNIEKRLPELKENLRTLKVNYKAALRFPGDMPRLFPGHVDPNMNLESMMRKILSFFGKLNPDWNSTVKLLINKGRIEVGQKAFKLQDAFSIVVPADLPLCYLYDVQGREGLYGLLHEVSHGIHFASYRGHPESWLLPTNETVELLPMTLELVAARNWEGEDGYKQRALTSVLYQYLAVYFQMEFVRTHPKSAQETQLLWKRTVLHVFGDAYEMNLDRDLSWCTHKAVWQDKETSLGYLIAGSVACDLSELILQNGALTIKRIDQLIIDGPHVELTDWRRLLVV